VAGAALVVLLGLVIVVLARRGQPLSVDLWMQRILESNGRGQRAQPARLVTHLGTGPVLYVLLVGLSALRLRHRAGRPVVWALLPVITLAAGQVLERVLFVTLPRPSPAGDLGLLAADGSFSSGHAAAATLGWGLVAALASAGPRSRRHVGPDARIPGSGACAVAMGAGVIVGVARIVLGVHWTTDVLAAIALGMVLLMAACAADALIQPHGAGSTDVAPRPMRARPTSPWLWLVPAVAALLPVVSLLLTPGPERLQDLLVYQGAGGAAGAGVDVYGFRTALGASFTYPPFAALLFEPLSRMPVGLVQVLWTAGTLAALVGLARVGLRPVVARIGLPLTVAALLLASPVRSHLAHGQVGVFLVLIVALDLLHQGPQRRTRGLGLGLAIAIKLTPAVFLPWLVATRSWARLRGTLAWMIGASLLGMLLLWRSASSYLLTASTDTARFGGNDIPGNQSVRGMMLRAPLPDGLVVPCWLAVSLILVAAATHGAWRLERAGQRLAAVGVLGCLSVAVSPISWVHHLVWLVLPIAALTANGWWKLALAWYLVLIPGLPALGTHAVRAGWSPPAIWQLGIEWQGLTVVAAVILLPILCLRREHGSPRGASSLREQRRWWTHPPRAGS